MKSAAFLQFLRNDRGASAVEYGLIAGLIAVAIVTTLGLIGTGLDGVFQTILNALP